MAAPSVLTRIGAGSLAALGVARGIGGLVLARGGGAVAGSERVSADTALLLALGLFAVAVLAVVAALRLWLGRPHALTLALASLTLFVVGGLVNGALLFGAPLAGGTAANLLAALAIGVLLGTGARATMKERR